jgi:hypothetical protein
MPRLRAVLLICLAGSLQAHAAPPPDEAADRRLAALASRLGIPLPAEPVRVVLHTSTVDKRAATGDDRPFTVIAERREVHDLVSPDGSIADPRGEALLLLRLAWGPPGSERLGLAVARWAAGELDGHPLLPYAARIARKEEPYPLREVLGSDSAQLSPIVADALGGAWVEWQVRSHGQAGKTALREIWSLREAAPDEKAWKRWLAGLKPEAGPARRKASSLPFQKGITLAHEGFRSGEGYGSDAALAQLGRLRQLGANSVTLVPYGFTRAPAEPTVRWLGSDETDDRVGRTLREARRLGLATVLKPQLWSHGWTGSIAFADDGAFRQWMAAYRRYILHYARLAELERADLLVIGTELGGLTGRQAEWRALIRDVRKVYSGPLTYAANWGDEVERIAFWNDLDFVGVNFYYPLVTAAGEEPRVGSPRLRELDSILDKLSKRHGKPVLFTEVGYAASAAAALEPWKEDNAALDPAMQARCYEVVFRSFYRRPWLAGLSWWKWPSPGRGSSEDPSFSPLGKPALAVLQRWYGDPALAR